MRFDDIVEDIRGKLNLTGSFVKGISSGLHTRLNTSQNTAFVIFPKDATHYTKENINNVLQLRHYRSKYKQNEKAYIFAVVILKFAVDFVLLRSFFDTKIRNY